MKIKHRLNWIFWRKVILIPAALIIFVALVYLLNALDAWDATEKALKKLPIDLSNPVVSGLLGAIVGGIFTIYGGIYTQARQFKVKGIVLRKNVIYSPIFDELIKLKRGIPTGDKYPVQIFFGKKEGYRPNGALSFDAWERIKSDVRFIEVPTYLAKELENFQSSGREYVQSRIEASERIYQKIRANIEDTELIEFIDMYHRSGYEFFLDYFLLGKPITQQVIEGELHLKGKEEQINDLTKWLSSCEGLQEIGKVKAQYHDFCTRLDDLVSSMQKIIDFIQRKYEHKSRSI